MGFDVLSAFIETSSVTCMAVNKSLQLDSFQNLEFISAKVYIISKSRGVDSMQVKIKSLSSEL